MRTGVSYMGHHNPRHMAADLDELVALGCDDVFLAAQENDFVYFPGKVEYFPRLCRERGLRPWAIFWGALNYFGGGKSSQFLLEFPEGHQSHQDGTRGKGGCYNNPTCVGYIKQMIDSIAAVGFVGYFVDEPSLLDCFCPACEELFAVRYHGTLREASDALRQEFRRGSVQGYVQEISAYVKRQYAQLETMCCLMERDHEVWQQAASITELDNLGTDLYWVNDSRPVEQMTTLVREMAQLCRGHGKQHHEWLQCWGVKAGREQRIIAQGEILLREHPDALYVWAYQGQQGTSESCENPEAAWDAACQVLRRAKSGN